MTNETTTTYYAQGRPYIVLRKYGMNPDYYIVVRFLDNGKEAIIFNEIGY
jgi:hypothetical protein